MSVPDHYDCSPAKRLQRVALGWSAAGLGFCLPSRP